MKEESNMTDMTENQSKAMRLFGVILDENAVLNGIHGKEYFASACQWNRQMLKTGLDFPACFTEAPFRHPVHGVGFGVFVPD